MDDLISRQKAIDSVKEKIEYNIETRPSWIDSIPEILEQLPSAVVRCKDCQHLGEYLTEEKIYPNWCMVNQQFVIHPENWFCKGGEGEDDE